MKRSSCFGGVGPTAAPALTFKQKLASSIGAGLVGLIQAGTGAVSRSVQEKLRDMVSADDFNVPTDGVSDCSAAVQAMLTAHPGNTVTLLPRTYKFLSGLSVPAGTQIQAWGATLDFSASHMTGLTFANGGGIVGAKKILGAGNSSYDIAGVAVTCAGTNNAPAAPTYVTGPNIQFCNFEGWGSYGVLLWYCTNAVVESNTFTHIGYGAAVFLSCTDSRADKNVISDVSPGTASNAYGISWTRAQGTLVADPVSLNCQANENVISDIPLWHGLDTHGGEGITFRGNAISNCKTSISCTSANVSGSTGIANRRCLVDGNTIIAGSTGSAIRAVGVMTGPAVDSYVEQIIIRGNKITGGGITGAVQGAIMLEATKDANIIGNGLAAPLLAGILLTSNNVGLNISGNTITDPWDNSSAAVACIIQSGNNNTGYIGGNTFAFRDAGLGANVATSSLRFTIGTTGNDINVGRNSFSGIVTGKLAFANSAVAGINVSQAYSEGGSATIAVTSAGTSSLIDIKFAKQFPAVPRIRFALAAPANGGGKLPIVTSANKTASGFRIIVYPFDLSSWTASGNVVVDWEAST